MCYGSAINCDSAWVLQKTIFNYMYLYFITRNFYISDNIILNYWDTVIYWKYIHIILYVSKGMWYMHSYAYIISLMIIKNLKQN